MIEPDKHPFNDLKVVTAPERNADGEPDRSEDLTLANRLVVA
jgi:hypothetical protein